VGRWDGRGRRQFVEEVARVDIRAWQRKRMLSPPGRVFAHRWQRGGQINVRVGRDAVTLIWGGEDGGQAEQKVRLSWLRKVVRNQVGHRAYFSCCCGRRCEVLYPGSNRWSCRRCAGVTYRSRFELKSQRGTRAAIRVQRRLGGATDGVTDVPAKPKWMRKHTYQRLVSKHWIARARLKARLGRRGLMKHLETGRGRGW
jgi:hypothetical protein